MRDYFCGVVNFLVYSYNVILVPNFPTASLEGTMDFLLIFYLPLIVVLGFSYQQWLAFTCGYMVDTFMAVNFKYISRKKILYIKYITILYAVKIIVIIITTLLLTRK